MSTHGAHETPDASPRTRSLWLDQLGEITPREPLRGPQSADIAIVGGGFTGLWAAYYLSLARPGADIVVLEREVVGFGAAGRNGGWAGAGMAGSAKVYAKAAGWDRALAGARLTERAVDEIGDVLAAEGIACDYRKGGTLAVATSRPQWERLRAGYAAARRDGTAEDGSRLLEADDALGLVRIPGVVGGLWLPHCARMQPARFVRGLAQACERRGVRILEHTHVRAIEPRAVRTDAGTVTAPVILRATEAWTPQLRGTGDSFLPLTSMMIATEPLDPQVWEEIGWPHGLTVRDRRNLFFYAQRTADDRIAIGGRGAPYRLRAPLAEFDASAAQLDQARAVWDRLERTLHTHIPAARSAAITHRWGGTLAVPRDWSMSVRYDAATGLGSAGGFAGHGVIAAYLAGRGLADLVAGRPSDYGTAPWVGHRSPAWEPEPLRFLAANAIVRLLDGADTHEDASWRTARRVRLLTPVLPPG